MKKPQLKLRSAVSAPGRSPAALLPPLAALAGSPSQVLAYSAEALRESRAYCRGQIKNTPRWVCFLFVPVSISYSPGAPRPSTALYLARLSVGGVRWDRSLPPPVADAGRRSVGNRKERWNIATMRVPRVTEKPTGKARARISQSSAFAGLFSYPIRQSAIIWQSQLMCSIVLG